MVEKPIAASLEQAREMADYDKKYPSLVTMVAENFRYSPGLLKVRDIISAGSIGDVYSVHWDDFNMIDTSVPYLHTRWRLEHKYPGGFVMDAGVHNIAGLRMLLGELEVKSAKTLSINPDIGEVDSITMTFETQGGVFGCFNDYFSSNGFNENRLAVLGTKGSVVLKPEGAKKVVTVAGREISEQRYEFDSSESYTGEFRDFYNAVTEGRQVRSTFEEGAKDFETMLSALEMAGADNLKNS
jgi:predicted dehydrogenase